MSIIHRDIKPENLLIASPEMGLASLKVGDFGLARQFTDSSDLFQQLASTTCGTPGYVAPEILEQEKYGKEVDYWSVGVVAFVVLSGTIPFAAEDNFELFEQIKKCDWAFRAHTWDNVSDEAKDFVKRILVRDPGMRLNFEQMKEHPWMSMQLDNKPLAIDKDALGKSQSMKAEKRKSFEAQPDIEDEKA